MFPSSHRPLKGTKKSKDKIQKIRKNGAEVWFEGREKKHLVMETRIYFLTWRCHEVHCKAMPGKKLRWESRESKLKSRNNAHISVLETALQMLKITLKAAVRVWIVLYIKEKWSKSRDSLS